MKCGALIDSVPDILIWWSSTQLLSINEAYLLLFFCLAIIINMARFTSQNHRKTFLEWQLDERVKGKYASYMKNMQVPTRHLQALCASYDTEDSSFTVHGHRIYWLYVHLVVDVKRYLDMKVYVRGSTQYQINQSDNKISPWDNIKFQNH